MVVWIWCRSQAALENIRKLNESNKLGNVLVGSAYMPTSGLAKSTVISIDQHQLKKTVGKFLKPYTIY